MIILAKTFLKFFGQKRLKMRFFRFFEKPMHGTFLVFLHEATAAGLKLTQTTFFGKSCSQNLRKGHKMSSLNLRALNFPDFFLRKVTAV